MIKSKKIVVATHNSKFHADDVFSIVILKKLFGDIEIIRTRDKNLLERADFLVDVGGKYNHESRDYDHHQDGSPIRDSGIPYSSCGLIWKHYGMELVNSKKAFDYVDKNLLEIIDAGDNGIKFEENRPAGLFVGNIVNLFNVNWDESSDSDGAFFSAVDFSSLFFERVLKKAKSISEGEEIVNGCLNEMSDSIVVLSKPRLPKEILSESKAKIFVEPTTVGTWVAVGVPVEPKSFIRKKYFPDSWAGLIDENLERVSGVKGLTFCHKHKFIIGGNTKEAVLEASKKALKE